MLSSLFLNVLIWNCQHEPDEEAKKAESMTREGLIRYMMSDENAPVLLDRLDIYQVNTLYFIV